MNENWGSYALRLAKIAAATRNPPSGTIDRDAAGRPSGVLKEQAQELVTDLIPPPSAEQRRNGILTACSGPAGRTIR